MRFGPVAIDQAEGAILAHSVAAGGLRLRKGRRLTAEDIAALRAAGLFSVIVARLDDGDLDEDRAAERIAAALQVRGIERKPPGTGRANLHAAAAGLFTVDRALVDAINRIDPSITLATVADRSPVEAGQMVATVKIIPFAAETRMVAEAEALAGRAEAMAVHPFKAMRVGLIQTVLPGLKPSVLDKTARITADRLAKSGSRVTVELRPAHDAEAVAEAIRQLAPENDLLLLFGASAVSDPEDVIPAAIRVAGGIVERVGMPVDPGNLLVLGSLDGNPVLGTPGCARSPKENGFDWVLDRISAGLSVTGDEIAGMGVGGLLMEIPSRPQPREPAPATAPRPPVSILLLAAGRSSRMGGPNKLLARLDGEPLIRRMAGRALAAKSAGVTVVTGHQAQRIREALAGLPVAFVDNPDFESGLASSLKAGIHALPERAGGALVMLGDMPNLTADELKRLIAIFQDAGGNAIVRATHAGKRGNPVVLPRTLFPSVMALEGDTGARGIVEGGAAQVVDVELGQAASLDVDTPEAMRAAGGSFDGSLLP